MGKLGPLRASECPQTRNHSSSTLTSSTHTMCTYTLQKPLHNINKQWTGLVCVEQMGSLTFSWEEQDGLSGGLYTYVCPPSISPAEKVRKLFGENKQPTPNTFVKTKPVSVCLSHVKSVGPEFWWTKYRNCYSKTRSDIETPLKFITFFI